MSQIAATNKINFWNLLKSFFEKIKYNKIKIAIENYLNSSEVKRGYVKNALTWFSEWQDWIDYKDIEKPNQSDEISRLDTILRKRLGKIAKKSDIKDVLKSIEPDLWNRVRIFLSQTYDDGQKVYFEAEKELSKEKVNPKVQELINQVAKEKWWKK